MAIDVLDAPPCRLGECPLWCARSARLWWVDVLEPALWSCEPASGRCRRHPISARRLGSIALRAAGGLLLACEHGLFAYDPDSGEQRFLLDPEPGRPTHRKNDGRADPHGSFWIGTLDEAAYAPEGSLYRVAADGSVTVVDSALRIPNSLAFDAARSRLYYADTRAYTIWCADCGPDGLPTGPRRTFATTVPPARPDGSCVDIDGCLWNAEYAGGRVVRYAPSGEIVETLDLPVAFPTCCSFGGPDLDRLFITTAMEPLTDAEREAQPLAGRVLVAAVSATGRPEYRVGL